MRLARHARMGGQVAGPAALRPGPLQQGHVRGLQVVEALGVQAFEDAAVDLVGRDAQQCAEHGGAWWLRIVGVFHKAT